MRQAPSPDRRGRGLIIMCRLCVRVRLEVVADAEYPGLCHSSERLCHIAQASVFPCREAACHVVGADVVVVEYLEGCAHLEAEVNTGGFL